ncbi:hypothetical protein [Streptomyces sp. CB03238]|uniref:hypothetical protein n=1 Tax=Streptomyces sp. CB03238 TaxID=1907777 RepID=UPI000A0FA201|nr:hypothetical protein [Streptomyces sp. CB03238]ORT55573.1 hypothetical protein BKD26_31165 [Streptomyces sp. CB03238]
MALGHRFHVDQDGHSITVQFLGGSGDFEVLVDGKVVAYGPGPRRGGTVRAELPGDPPRSVGITVSDPREMGGVPFCVLESGGMRYLMPQVPLVPPGGAGEGPARRGSYRPVRRLRRFVRRSLRRLMRRR